MSGFVVIYWVSVLSGVLFEWTLLVYFFLWAKFYWMDFLVGGCLGQKL